ncbi:MAG: hypothetical protein U1E05_27430, partial [Patescibacteria group bacterium]|nr:hypothetical protein [Patescibacteria group bacterium]
QTGARLLVEQVAWDVDLPDGAAKAIVAAVQAASRRFPRRVERVYAVLPFVSRNLSHEYDYLQRACASLLADALRSQDSVAVVEIEEARQIAREIAMTDGKEIRPIVPLIIEGEFHVAREALKEEPVVRFDIRVQGNEGPINLPSHAISLSAMPRYLARDLPARILGSPFQDDAPLTLDQQVSALVARANVFADLGAWEHSTSLREAALLLEDNPGHRLRLISEYRRMAQAPLPTGVVKHSQSHAAECARRLRLWACTLPHVAFLIRNKQLEAPEAVALLRPLMHFEQMYHVRNDASPEDMELAEKARRQFVRSVYTPLLEQAAATKDPRLAHDAIESLIIDNRRFDRFDREYLDLIYELFEHATPDEVRCRPPLFCPTFGWDFEQCDEATIRNGLEFYGRLARSERLDNQLTGRLGLLCLEWTRGGSPEVFLRRAEALEEEFAKAKEFTEANLDQRGILMDFRMSMRAELEPPTLSPKRPPEPPPAKPPPQVGYEPLDLSVKTLQSRLQPVRHMRWNAVREVWNPALRLVNCDEVDFYWREGVLLMHRQELLLEEILVEPEAVFSDAAWDGVYLWLAAS